MPKLKTHKGAAKRFKKTGTGKSDAQSRLWPAYLDLETAQTQRKLHQRVLADSNQPARSERMLPY